MRRQRRKLNRFRLIITFIIVLTSVALPPVIFNSFYKKDNVEQVDTKKEGVETKAKLPKVSSKNVLLLEVDGGEVFSEKPDEKIYPASMTKVMTALVAIENQEDLSETFTIPYDMYNDLYEDGASLAGFSFDEELSYLDLLYGLMLPSGADAAKALSIGIFGDVDGMVRAMNEKAKQLGMNNTNFMNADGLHHFEHYTTPREMAILMNYSLGNNQLTEIMTTAEHTTAPSNKHEDGVHLESTLFYHLPTTEINGGKILGGKTGYTDEAGQCLASFAEKNGKKYILITAGASDKGQNLQSHILDAVEIYNGNF